MSWGHLIFRILNADFPASGDDLIRLDLQVPDPDALGVEIPVSDKTRCQKDGQPERDGFEHQRARLRKNQLVKNTNQLQRQAGKKEQKDKGHPDVADAGEGSRQMFIMQCFQRADDNRRQNKQEDAHQDQSLQQTGKMENASGAEKEVKIDSAVKAQKG